LINSYFIDEVGMMQGVSRFKVMSKQGTPFGDEVKRLRSLRGLSQDELSRLSGISLGLISQIERGKHANPSILTVARLDKSLKCRGRLFKFLYETLN